MAGPAAPGERLDRVAALKRRLGNRVPSGWTPHWFRHTHASALLLAGAREHVVMRRLGHADIQTTLNLYGWVTEDAELRALADWRSFNAGWRGWEDADVSHPATCTLSPEPRTGWIASRLWWPAFPEVFAGTAFDPADPVLGQGLQAGSVMVLRTDALPVPMQREVSWWLATCHANGERVVQTMTGNGGWPPRSR